jgi:RecA-family ATPase
VYIRSYLTVTASAGGIGKTSLALAEAIAISTGKPILQRPVREQTNVWVINLEDPRAEMNLRLASLMQHYHVSHEDLAGRLFIDGEDDIQITLAAEGRDGVITNDALLDLMTAKIKQHNIGCVIVDPFVSSACRERKQPTSTFRWWLPCCASWHATLTAPCTWSTMCARATVTTPP